LGRQSGLGGEIHRRSCQPGKDPQTESDHVLLAWTRLARPPPDRVVQAQSRRRHPARARTEFRRDRRSWQPHRDDAHCHDDRRRAGEGWPARRARGHLHRTQSGIQGYSHVRRARLSRRAREYLVLALWTEGPSARSRQQAQRGHTAHREIAEDPGPFPKACFAVEGPGRSRRPSIPRRGIRILGAARPRCRIEDSITGHFGDRTMNVVTTLKTRDIERPLPAPRARIGMIIPSVNSMTEPQFNRFAPPALGVHVARARVAGEWKRPLAMMADEIATSAKLLSDVAPDLIVFHCTDTSMTQGPQGEGRILDIVREASGIEALATSRLVLEALQALGLRKLVVLSPYKSNQAVIDYLHASGFLVVH